MVFIAKGREAIGVFPVPLNFDEPLWTLPFGGRASNTKKRIGLYFTTHEGGHAKSMDRRIPLREPFASFLKAVVCLRQQRGAKFSSTHSIIIRAARYLYDALEARGAKLADLLPEDFIVACKEVKAREEPSSRYKTGQHLLELVGYISRFNLTKITIDFVNPFPRSGHGDSRIDPDSVERRDRNLPSEASLDALAQIANLVVEPGDVLLMRCVELLVCGGWRINELLTVPADCEVFEPVVHNGEPILDAAGNPLQRYGIRYFAEKGGGPSVKWIPTAMVDVARRAVADITRITEPFRKVAVWNVANPGRAWLPDGWRGKALHTIVTAHDIPEMLDVVHGASLLKLWCGTSGSVRQGVPLAVLERAMRKRMSWLNQPGEVQGVSKQLFLTCLNMFHSVRGEIPAIVLPVTNANVADFLTSRLTMRTVFDRFGFKEADGSLMNMRSHQFRHWLNTLAQQGGMGQMEIARWSGRKDVGQNAAYDHTSGFELAERARAHLAGGKLVGPIARVHDRLPLADRKAFRDSQLATAHTTDLGMCTNDWSLAPCMEHGSCAACPQHLLVKGDAVRRARAEVLLEEHEFLLAGAEAEAGEETYGANNFVAHHKRMRDALRSALEVHGDNAVEDGTLVQITLSSSNQVGAVPSGGRTSRAA
ncbi:hypothetical protein EAH89_14655 [Roseomonas nepalensis]|uniref:Integrase n=1 Tax=Muricoccus nepalensis TaxID=1854500 RepID=A0A502G0W0_9PROT|nr:hypothetical protein EAH89_14655 [Roseomonas nepalensis]